VRGEGERERERERERQIDGQTDRLEFCSVSILGNTEVHMN